MTATRTDKLRVSTEALELEIEWKVGGRNQDPTAYTAYVAFGTSEFDEPAVPFTAPAWHQADWLTVGARYFLEPATGPLYSAIAVGAGRWHVFVGLDDGSTTGAVIYGGVWVVR